MIGPFAEIAQACDLTSPPEHIRLIGIGLDGYNPLEAEAGLDVKTVREYGTYPLELPAE